MFGKRRTNQGGSVATFAVVGVILAVVLIGGLYFVNIRGRQARETQEIATSETKKTKSTDSTKEQSNTSNNEEQTDNSADNVDSTSPVVAEDSSSRYLPETGLEIDPLQLVGVYLLATSLIAYFLSRRELTHSL